MNYWLDVWSDSGEYVLHNSKQPYPDLVKLEAAIKTILEEYKLKELPEKLEFIISKTDINRNVYLKDSS